MNPILLPATRMMNRRLIGQKVERLNARGLRGAKQLLLSTIRQECLILLLILVAGSFRNRGTQQRGVADPFVPQTVTSEGQPDHVLRAGSSRISGESARMSSGNQPQLHPQPGASRQEDSNTGVTGEPDGRAESNLKDEYDYTRFTHDFYEYEQGQRHIIVKDRLKEHVQFWRNIGTTNFILDIIENGYKIPLYSTPPRSINRNNKSALAEAEFVKEAIQDLLDRSLIAKCLEPPYVVNPLTVSVQSSGKKRLILDLRVVNKHIWKQSVKYEDLKIALSYLQRGFYMFKFDLTSAYHFINIYEGHTKFLGFSWLDNEGNVLYYKFLVLPFGLSSACYVFSKVTRPLVSKWRGEGKMVVTFLDDGFGCAQGFDETSRDSVAIKNDLLASGFVPNSTKCIWQPVQTLEFLGVILDSLQEIIYIPDRRLQKARDTIVSIFDALKVHRRVHVKKVASVVGQIISMSVVVGSIAQIMSRSLSVDIVKAPHWEAYIPLSTESIGQLEFWRENLNAINSKGLLESHKYSKIVYSDASNTGYAGYAVDTVGGVSHGMWSENESTKSSTWRELVAVLRVLNSLSHILKNQRVKWFSDNLGVTSIVHKGSMKKDLQEIAIEIFRSCLRQSICLNVEWIPRSGNDKADYLSRIVDQDDWGISFELLNLISSRFGKFDVDWFASEDNAKVSVFYSRFWNPSSAGIDAFTENWACTYSYGLFVPPISVILRVLRKMMTDRATGVLVLPCWKSAPFWPFICPSGGHFVSAVVDWLDLPTNKCFYTPCRNGKGVFGNLDLNFRMFALKLDFRYG